MLHHLPAAARKFALLPALGLLATAPPPAPAQLVVPGRSLGGLRLGADPALALPPLGPPAFSDAATLKAWATWYGRGRPPAQLDVFTSLRPGVDTRKSIQAVRATSPYFCLANGLRAGSTLAQVRAAYGRLPLVATYRLAAGPRYLYDDARRGIAFETDGQLAGSHCRALVVHEPGAGYLSLAGYLKDLPAPK